MIGPKDVDKLLASTGLFPSDESSSETPPEVPDLGKSLKKLQEELAQWTMTPTTPAEIVAYDEGLQQAAVEKALSVVAAEDLLAELEKRPALKEDPQIRTQMTAAVSFLTGVDSKPALAMYIEQAKSFLECRRIKSFSALREKMEQLAEKKLAFRTRRDPRLTPPKGAVVLRESGDEALYMPHNNSIVSRKMWGYATAAFERAREASAERKKGIREERDAFRKRATPGLTPYKAVKEGRNGALSISVTVQDKISGRQWLSDLLLTVANSWFTLEDTFRPDRIEDIRRHFVWSDSGKQRWFPLDPQEFNLKKVPEVVQEIVWPILKVWYESEEKKTKAIELDQAVIARSQEIQRKSEISPTDVLAGKPGFCGVFIRNATTNQYGPDDLTLGMRGTGNGTFVLEEYLSRRNVFNFQLSVGKEIPIAEEKGPESHQPITQEETVLFAQARILRGLLKTAAFWQRPTTPPPQPEGGR